MTVMRKLLLVGLLVCVTGESLIAEDVASDVGVDDFECNSDCFSGSESSDPDSSSSDGEGAMDESMSSGEGRSSTTEVLRILRRRCESRVKDEEKEEGTTRAVLRLLEKRRGRDVELSILIPSGELALYRDPQGIAWFCVRCSGQNERWYQVVSTLYSMINLVEKSPPSVLGLLNKRFTWYEYYKPGGVFKRRAIGLSRV